MGAFVMPPPAGTGLQSGLARRAPPYVRSRRAILPDIIVDGEPAKIIVGAQVAQVLEGRQDEAIIGRCRISVTTRGPTKRRAEALRAAMARLVPKVRRRISPGPGLSVIEATITPATRP